MADLLGLCSDLKSIPDSSSDISTLGDVVGGTVTKDCSRSSIKTLL